MILHSNCNLERKVSICEWTLPVLRGKRSSSVRCMCRCGRCRLYPVLPASVRFYCFFD